MSWIELHQSVWTHRKTYKCAVLLKKPRVVVVAHLASLWTWGLDNIPMSGIVDRDLICEAAEWTGRAATFIDALVEARYLDVVDGAYHVHSWEKYAGRLITKRAVNAERMRLARAANVQRTDSARAGATVPDRTGPSPDHHQPETVAAPTQAKPRETKAQKLERVLGEQITNDWIDEMVAEFPVLQEDEVRSVIRQASIHKNLGNYVDRTDGLRIWIHDVWLKKRAKELLAMDKSSTNGHSNGAASPFAAYADVTL